MRKWIALALTVLIAALPMQAARSFNGTTAFIDLGADTALNFTSYPMTIAGWINTATIGNSDFDIIVHGRNGTGGWKFKMHSNGTSAFIAYTQIGAIDINSTLTLSTNTWTFAAVVLTSTSAEHFVKITTGGTVTTNDQATTQATTGTSNTQTAIGAGWNGASTQNEFWNGSIGPMAVWFKNLSDAQLKSFAFGGPDSAGVPPPVGYWPIWGSATEPDLSGNKFNGTVTATAVVNPAFPMGKYGSRP